MEDQCVRPSMFRTACVFIYHTMSMALYIHYNTYRAIVWTCFADSFFKSWCLVLTTRINLSLPEDSTSYPDHRTATSLYCWAFGTGFGLWKVGSSAKRTTMIWIHLVSFERCYYCLCFYKCIAVLYLDTICKYTVCTIHIQPDIFHRILYTCC